MSTPVPPVPGVPLVPTQIGNGDAFVLVLIPKGTEQLQVLTDGSKSEAECALMLIAALNTFVTRLALTAEQKEPSRIVDPFSAIRSRFRG